MAKTDPWFIVGAIDFGTTYSGWAFSFRHEPEKVIVKDWHSGYGITSKTSTCLLANKDGSFKAFGYSAENEYRDLLDTENHGDYYYFKRFKMALCDKLGQGLNRTMILRDEQGKEMLALNVFAMSIRYLSQDLLEHVRNKGIATVEPEDIHWVLTVPAIWSDAAKQFMRESADMAGLPSSQLTVALEPEAASLHCRHLPVGKTKSGNKFVKLLTGSKYLILDAGGGTVDITVHEIQDNDKLREVRAASGGGWGGTMVDYAFESLLISLFTKSVVDEFKQTEKEDWEYLLREFEFKKREAGGDNKGRVVMTFPASLGCIYKNKVNRSPDEAVETSKYSEDITIKGNKIKFSQDVFRDLFKESTCKTVAHVQSLVRDETMQNVNVIFMVGGYSESPYLQKAVKKMFPEKQVVIPPEASSAILKGAVMFGRNPSLITERVLKYTYGVDTTVPFEVGKHPESKRFQTFDGENRCSSIFVKFAEKEQLVKIGETQVEKEFEPSSRYQRFLSFTFYASEKKCPIFVDDEDSVKGGEMDIPLEGKYGGNALSLSMLFGGTEIVAKATDKKTEKETKVNLNFLG